MGPLIQDSDIDGQVAIRGAFTTKEDAKAIGQDLNSVKDNTVVIASYGTGDLEKGSLQSSKVNIDCLLEQVIAENGRVKLGILKVPPQLNQKRNDLARELNKYLEYRCKDCQDITVIDAKLSFKDIRKEGTSVNYVGKTKQAVAIRSFVNLSQKKYRNQVEAAACV